MTSRRDLIKLVSAAPLALAACRSEDAAPTAGAGPDAGVAAPASPWPTYDKLMKTNADLRAALAKVKLTNGDAPDTLPRVVAMEAGPAGAAPAASAAGASAPGASVPPVGREPADAGSAK